MLLVSGGQLDPNIGALLRRCITRGVAFRDLLVGPELTPCLRVDLDGRLILNGEEIQPIACFLRHDVFLAQKSGSADDHRAALNWYQAVRDWALSWNVRFLNRRSRSGDQGKYTILAMARSLGLPVPATVLTNVPPQAFTGVQIRKPAAGGELTALVGAGEGKWRSPYFVQPRLLRPELRIYRIGATLLGFELRSEDLDYRSNHKVQITPALIPDTIAPKLIALCDELGLDFAAADFMQDGEGCWHFLEVNSQPMFAAFDAVLDGQLSDRIIDWLLSVASVPQPIAAVPS